MEQLIKFKLLKKELISLLILPVVMKLKKMILNKSVSFGLVQKLISVESKSKMNNVITKVNDPMLKIFSIKNSVSLLILKLDWIRACKILAKNTKVKTDFNMVGICQEIQILNVMKKNHLHS